MTCPLLIALALNALWVAVVVLLYHRLWVAPALSMCGTCGT